MKTSLEKLGFTQHEIILVCDFAQRQCMPVGKLLLQGLRVLQRELESVERISMLPSCLVCGTEQEWLPGRNAHSSNLYCPKCDNE